MSFSPSGHRCWAEIHPEALRHNAGIAGASGMGVIAVIKADGYGHGAVRVARALENQVAAFAVSNVDELRELREAHITTPILILSVILPHEREIAHELLAQVCVSSEAEARGWNHIGQTMGRPVPVHWAVDTGMGRTGFFERDWTPELISRLASLPGLFHAGIGSHFPSSDEDQSFSILQIQRFAKIVELTRANGIDPQTIHIANSGGITGYAENLRGFCTHVRAGLMLYGVDPMVKKSRVLQTTLTWKCRVSLVRMMPKGHGICYGRTHITTRPTLVATLTAGYADGLPRSLSNHTATVCIQGISCPILGRVTMDQIVADVSALPHPPVPGDEVILIGTNESEQSAEDMAEKAHTIAWEIFTNLSRRVKRVSQSPHPRA